MGDDPEFAAAAAAAGTRIIDYRGPRSVPRRPRGRKHLPGKRVILTAGTDCAIGKMSVALELRGGRPTLRATTPSWSRPARPG